MRALVIAILLLLSACANKSDPDSAAPIKRELNKSGYYDLEWDYVPSAAGYRIYHGYTPTGSVDEITVGTPFTIYHEFTTLAKDQTHYFAVAAINGSGAEISRTRQISVNFR